jgi:hypothetical protein
MFIFNSVSYPLLACDKNYYARNSVSYIDNKKTKEFKDKIGPGDLMKVLNFLG